MKITLSKKINDNDHLVVVSIKGDTILKSNDLDLDAKEILRDFLKKNKDRVEVFETFHFKSSKRIKSLTLIKIKNFADDYKFEGLGGRLLNYLEKKRIKKFSLLIEELKTSFHSYFPAIIRGIALKNYKFEKYKTISKKDFSVESLQIINKLDKIHKSQKNQITSINNLKGIFLTRDLVSEPANILYPEKFVEICNVMKKVGVKIEVFDEKKIKKLGMNALMGVAQGSVKPPRVMIMKWSGGSKNDKFSNPLAFVGKGVTFDTGGISIKPSGGMEDMKWDMGGAGVVAGLIYTLALRKSKASAIGIVGLVENMPDGNAQRPGDIVKSLSGQTIEVLNTDAEGRLVLADVLWYVKEKFKPKLMVDLATLTGAIIVALGERYAGLFSNSDSLANKLLEASKKTGEPIWRLPMDEKFDKLLDCPIADMKNITGTRGAGSITAAQFLKRFVGSVDWAHLDIAGVTWSKKGTDFSRPGGTGFGVRLLDQFVRSNYE